MGRDGDPRKDEDQPDGADWRGDDSFWPGKELLGGSSAREVLARLVDGDPLELASRTAERLRATAFLVSPQRLHLRAVARIAHASRTYRGRPELSLFITERIDASIYELMQEDREEERYGIPTDAPKDPRNAFLSEVLGVEPQLARRASIAFNRLGSEMRHTYFAIAVEGKSVNRFAAESNEPPRRVKQRLASALKAIAEAVDEPPRSRGEATDESP